MVTDLRIYQVSCTDRKLPVDESEVEAMWEDAQQLVQCKLELDISTDYDNIDNHNDQRGYVEDFNDSSGGGGGEEEGEDPLSDTVLKEGTIYMGHAVGTDFYVEGESDTEDSMGGVPSVPLVANRNFKSDVIRRAQAREQTRTTELDKSLDPLRRYYLKYDSDEGKLCVGSVEVIINEEDETLQCSQCSIMGKRSKSNHQSKQNWRDMEKGVLVHIIGKHLGGFTCLHCHEIFTSHTMIKKHVSKEHAGHTVSSISSVATTPPPSVIEKPAQKLKQYVCSICPSAYSKPSELKRHFIAKHAPEQQVEVVSTTTSTTPVAQPLASAKLPAKRKGGTASSRPVFVSGGTVEKTIPLKSAQRPHECHVCKYAFIKSSHLKRHLEMHRKRNELV